MTNKYKESIIKYTKKADDEKIKLLYYVIKEINKDGIEKEIIENMRKANKIQLERIYNITKGILGEKS